MRLFQNAEDDAVKVFAGNLRDLLLASPAGARATMGLDPGFRTGVKVAVVDSTGKVLDTTAIYPHEPQRRWDEAMNVLAAMCARHKVDLVAIGNGTASRETEKLVLDLLKKYPELKLTKAMVSEAGASVYSASAFASQELPGLDVTLRGAVSIARRLQDPLAELVKIDPKSIGVGQYQHDIAEHKLSRSLDAVVEDCVNAVGVDVNTASAPLLARVSGVGETLAQNIVQHRDENGAFRSRADLKKVPRLGPKAFEQCAGFLRILGGDDPLDSSSVHPEAYPGRAPDHRGDQERHQGAHRRREDVARAGAAEVHRREVRRAHRHRHSARTGKARPRSAPRIQDGGIQGRRGDAQRSAAGHDPGRRGHERRGVRRLRRHRRASGRARAHLGHVAHVREGPARGRQARRHREGQGAGGGQAAQAHRADHAAR